MKKMLYRSADDPNKKNLDKYRGFSSVIYAQRFTGFQVHNESIRN
jgi:hypothetical protein